MSLFDAFAEGLAPEVDPAEIGVEPIEALLRQSIAAARIRWPGVELDPRTFAAAVAHRWDRDGVEGLQRLALEDLYLAVACLERDPRAEDILRRALVEPVVQRVFDASDDLDEQAQRVLIGLLVGGPRGGPKLQQFGGRGALRAWLRISILRAAKNTRRAAARAPRREPLSIDTLHDEAMGGDPEFDEIRRAHSGAFEAAFAAGIARLPALERRLLRQHHLQGFTLEQLSTIYAIHPVTASRRLSRSRQRLVGLVREELVSTLGVSSAELDRTIAAILSKVELSFERLMASREDL